MTAIIVGILVTVFIFVLAVLIFAKILWTTFRRRRDIVAVNTNSFALSGAVGGVSPPDDQAAAINVSLCELLVVFVIGIPRCYLFEQN